MTETKRIFHSNPYQQLHVHYFNVIADVSIDYIYGCIYIPGQVHTNGVLSEFNMAFQGFLALNISYATLGREYRILGYQTDANGEKQLVATLHGPASDLHRLHALHLLQIDG